MSGTTPEIDALAGNLDPRTGCSRLCYTLAGIGLAISAASALSTYHLLHEPLEAVGASVVEHLASSKCTAISRALTALTVAKHDVLNGEPEGERSQPDAHASVGVVTPGTWDLENYHSSTLPADKAIATLRSLPLLALNPGKTTQSSPLPISEQKQPAHVHHQAPEHNDLTKHSCNQLGYGLSPSAVRVFRAPHLPDGWLAFLQGPWNQEGQRKVSFALVDLRASTMEMGVDHHAMDGLFPGGLNHKLAIQVSLHPLSMLDNHQLMHNAVLDLAEEDRHLHELRIVPFANQLVSTHLQIDHRALDRISRRSAALVFLMGLLATTAVVLVSRSSELRLHRLNQALLQESRSDGLTRIANRRAWDEALALEESRRQRSSTSFGVVVVDLDRFKKINDLQGHQVGDQVLQVTASVLASQLRSTDLLARVGGDEFAVLVFNPTPNGLDDLTTRLRRNLRTAGIEASIGSATGDPGLSLEQTWARADAVMYRSKLGSPERARSGEPTPIPEPANDNA
ncbi:MAG: GGDEF domain-containing protein [Vulcanococcus sp.]